MEPTFYPTNQIQMLIDYPIILGSDSNGGDSGGPVGLGQRASGKLGGDHVDDSG
jgi:hypothetical protein